MDLIPSRAIPKALKMVPVATLLGAQNYKASTGFSSLNIYHATNIASLTNKSAKKGPIIIIVCILYGRLAVMLNMLSSINIEINHYYISLINIIIHKMLMMHKSVLLLSIYSKLFSRFCLLLNNDYCVVQLGPCCQVLRLGPLVMYFSWTVIVMYFSWTVIVRAPNGFKIYLYLP